MDLRFFGTSGAVPAAEDGNVSFAVSAGADAVLVDVSGNPLQSLLRSGLDPRALQAVVLTHAHPDHLYALPSLVQGLWLMKRKLPLSLLTDPVTAEKARRLLDLFGLLEKRDMYELAWKTEGAAVAVGEGMRVIRFPVEHSIPTSGVRIESGPAALAYSADSAPCSAILEAARGCRALIHEASGSASSMRALNEMGHSAGVQAGETAARAGVASLYLCHFDRTGASTPEDMRAEARRSFSGAVVIPEPFEPYSI